MSTPRLAVFTWLLAGMPCPVAGQQSPPPPPAPPEVAITGPTVIAFWKVPSSNAELAADTLLAMALDNQQYYWAGTRDLLVQEGIAARGQPGRRFTLRDEFGRRVFTASPDSSVVGYIFVAPGREPHVVYRIQFPEILVAAARTYFAR